MSRKKSDVNKNREANLYTAKMVLMREARHMERLLTDRLEAMFKRIGCAIFFALIFSVAVFATNSEETIPVLILMVFLIVICIIAYRKPIKYCKARINQATEYSDINVIDSLSSDIINLEIERIQNINRRFSTSIVKKTISSKNVDESTIAYGATSLKTTDDVCKFQIRIKNIGNKKLDLENLYSKLDVRITCDAKVEKIYSGSFDFTAKKDPNTFTGMVFSQNIPSGKTVRITIIFTTDKRIDDFSVNCVLL